jgi:hypothetical protein
MSTMTLPSVDTPQQQNKQRPLKPGTQPSPILKVDIQPAVPNDEDNYQTCLEAFARVDVNLPVKHRAILRAMLRELQDTGAKLQDGTKVTDKTKAILYLLENEAAR